MAMSVVLTRTDGARNGGTPAVVLLINRSGESVRFALPEPARGDWQIRFVSDARDFRPIDGNRWQVPERSLVCVALDQGPSTRI